MVITLKHHFPIRYKTGSTSHLDYPFKRMLVGESFVAPPEFLTKIRIAQKAYEKANPGIRFKEESAGKEIRIWRRK